MRITEHHIHPAADQVKPAPPSSSGPAASSSSQATQVAAPSSQSAVQVSVSAAARELANASPAAGFDEAKVAHLRSAVDAGTLKIDHSKIAERIAEGD